MPAVPSDHRARDLQRFAREHHVSYDVVEDAQPAAGQQGRAFELRLFATHGEDKLEAPLCPRSTELARELQSFASGIVASVDGAGWAEIMEPPPVVYAAASQRGPAEVSLALHVLGDPNESGAADGHVRTLEQNLKALGISRR